MKPIDVVIGVFSIAVLAGIILIIFLYKTEGLQCAGNPPKYMIEKMEKDKFIDIACTCNTNNQSYAPFFFNRTYQGFDPIWLDLHKGTPVNISGLLQNFSLIVP